MLTYSRLRELQRLEMQNAELAAVEEGFYSELRSFLEARKAEALSTQNLLVIKECENVKRIAKSIISKRMEKIVLISIRGKNDVKGLAQEEREFLARLREVVDRNEAVMHGLVDSEKCGISVSGTDAVVVGGAKANIKRIRFTKDIHPYKGLDEKVYGPFRAGEEAELPGEEAQWLLKEKMAELLQ